jgi:arylsulfatase A-like enzyme
MTRQERLLPVTTGILVGLGWGLLVSLLEGLPLLLQGSPWPYLGQRLLAWAYLAVIYGGAGAIAGAVLGGLAWLGLRLGRRRPSRAVLAAAYAGSFATATLAIWGVHRFRPAALGWGLIAILAILAGGAVGWLLHRAARGRAVRWVVFRSVVVVTFGVAAVSVPGVAGFRAALRDLPLFNPPTTDEVATVEHPNIVLITAGGMRPDHLTIYGYDPEISPNIDALAWRGVRFERAIAQASWTEPSLASLLTSLYPSELGITCWATITCQPHLDRERVTLAEALQGVGYRTQAYLTSPWLTAELGFDQGFDGFESVRAEEPFDLAAMRARTLGWLSGCDRGAAPCRWMEKGHEFLFDTPIPPGWGGGHANDGVERFLKLHSEERFFLWVHYVEALPPYDLEPPFRPMPEGELASPARRLARLGYWELGDPFTRREELLPLDVEGLRALYDGEIHRVDWFVGELNVLLDAAGLSDRTLVVFTSDHGQEFLEHGGYTYGHTLYDEVLRVPLIFAWPGVTAPGQVAETPVGLVDLAPTLAEIAGTSLPPETEGQSLVPALRGATPEARPIFSESLYRVPRDVRALYQGSYKLIYDVDDDRFELYNLSTDPDEQRNLDGEASQVAEALKRELMAWMSRTAQVMRDLPRAVPPREFTDAVW